MDNYQENNNVNGYSLVPINKHNFEKEKNDILNISKEVPSEISFTPVEVDGGLFGWGDHHVTGSEMNGFIGNVQKKFIGLNKIIRDVYKAFEDVYEVFDFLDAEYIAGIVKNSESAFNASQQALKAQQDILVTVGNLKKTVEKLCELQKEVKQIDGVLSEVQMQLKSEERISKQLTEDVSRIIKYQSKLKSYTHLDEIDTIWSDIKSQKDELREIHKWEDEISVQTKQIVKDIDKLLEYRSKLESYAHLDDIDSIWSDIECHKNELQEIRGWKNDVLAQIKQVALKINKLQEYCLKLESYAHLDDIDAIWSDVEGHKVELQEIHRWKNGVVVQTKQTELEIDKLKEFRSTIESYTHIGDIDSVWVDVNSHKATIREIHSKLDALISETESTTTSLQEKIQLNRQKQNELSQITNKKVRTAYVIAGSAVLISIAHFVLHIIGVL